jgi:preprotein translocase subunit SecY
VDHSLLDLFRHAETRQRIMRTLGLLICYRIGFQIPIPGMSPEFLSQTASKGVFGLLSTLSGGRIGQTTVFALGIMPYISASIIFSMLTKISPTLEAVSKEAMCGRARRSS